MRFCLGSKSSNPPRDTLARSRVDLLSWKQLARESRKTHLGIELLSAQDFPFLNEIVVYWLGAMVASRATVGIAY